MEDRVHLGEELSDVLINLVRLSDCCHVNLPAAAMRKFEVPVGKDSGATDITKMTHETTCEPEIIPESPGEPQKSPVNDCFCNAGLVTQTGSKFTFSSNVSLEEMCVEQCSMNTFVLQYYVYV